MIQTIIVILILAIVIVIAVKKTMKVFSHPKEGNNACSSGCDGCKLDCQLKEHKKDSSKEES